MKNGREQERGKVRGGRGGNEQGREGRWEGGSERVRERGSEGGREGRWEGGSE